ncbi:MAG: (d)CMP kinase [Dehalococcoidia bacterium]
MAASVIAIDGPVASGKSAVGLQLSRDLGYRLVDTGMIYRALTWLALDRGIDLEDAEALTVMAKGADFGLTAPDENGRTGVTIEKIDVTDKLRLPEVDRAVPLVSRVPGVREATLVFQRRLAADGHLVMLGRDIGTVVLPDAPLKVYLDASAEERARRRHLELQQSGVERPYEEILAELRARDEMDSNRHTSPLKAADGALIINTDGLTLEQVIARVRAAADALK